MFKFHSYHFQSYNNSQIDWNQRSLFIYQWIQKGKFFQRYYLILMKEQQLVYNQTAEFYGNMWKYEHEAGQLSPTNVTMSPFQIPESQFEEVKEMNSVWAKLFIKMSEDFQALEMLHKDTKDPMIQKLLAIAKKASSKNLQKTKGVFFRNDFIYNDQKKSFNQTQINLIAAGMITISEKTQEFHEMINKMTGKNWKLYKQPGIKKFVDFILKLLRIYQEGFPQSKGCVLKVSQGNGECQIQQSQIQKQIWLRGQRIINGSFNTLMKRLVYDEESGKISVDGYEVGVVYYRNSFNQRHYPTEECWKVRQILQCSRAVKVSNVQIQLVNFKNAQTFIHKTDILKRYLTEEQIVKIKRLQTDFWTPEDIRDNLEQIIKKNGQNLVVKSIHEGTEEHYFYKEAHKALRQNDPAKYCVMELIKQKSRPVTILVKGKNFIHVNGVTQICLFGSGIYDDKQIKEYDFVSCTSASYDERIVDVTYGIASIALT